MAKEREKFVAGCVATGYDEKLGSDWFDIIEPFADYAFNKSHSYGYGFVAYQTAYLKAHYPVEYLAALLTSVKDDKDKTAVYLAECRNLGIQVLVPDVNVSQSDFIARGGSDAASGTSTLADSASGIGSIPFGLSAIRNVGEGLVAKIVEERDANGPFTDFYDFCERVDPMVLNKRTVESLIKGGGFDSMGHPRKGLLLVFEQIVDATLARRREKELGIMNLFGDMESPEGGGPIHDERVVIPGDEFDKSQRLAFEKEMLGLYVSDHPLMGVEGALSRHTDCSINGLRELRDGETRWVGGVVTALQRKYTRRGELMATFVLEDLEAAMEVMVFPRTMHEYGPLLDDDAIVCVKGRVDLREEPAKIICLELKRPELVADENTALHVNLPATRVTGSLIDDLKKVLLEHGGQVPVFLHLGEKILRLPDPFNVATNNGLLAELRVLLGPNGLLS